MTNPYINELRTGQRAVRAASLLTKNILNAHSSRLNDNKNNHHHHHHHHHPNPPAGILALDKTDQTPVTIADFAAQALIISIIHAVFPEDAFLGEETAETLRRPGSEELMERVWEEFSSSFSSFPSDGGEKGVVTRQSMLDMIDLGGKGQGGSKGRVWVLDPVDGTATFIRGQQYAVCLALLEDGVQKVAVLGCPNLAFPVESNIADVQVLEDVVDRDGYGVMVSAVTGQGAFIEPILSSGEENGRQLARPLPRVAVSVSDDDDDGSSLTMLRFVDCQAAPSSAYDKHAAVAARLKAPWPPSSDLWSAQMRYIALAFGGCNTLLKIPTKKSYRSNTWDHAGGMLIATEVGYQITDLRGKPADCGLGRKLADTHGLVVAPLEVHSHVLKAAQEVAGENGIL